jgi:hypothetical protein
MEFAVLAAAETGADVRSAQAAVEPWFIPVILVSALTFLLGALAFARAVATVGLASRNRTRLVVGALTVAAVARFVPLTGVQSYLHSTAAVAALWPLAFEMWTRPARATAAPTATRKVSRISRSHRQGSTGASSSIS